MANVEDDQDLDTGRRNPYRLRLCAVQEGLARDSVSHGGEQPFAGGYLYRFGALYLLQIKNMTIQAGVVRTAGKLPVKPTREVVGAISYGSSAGYVSVHEDGTVYCTSKASGDFSGQVCFVA